MPLFFIGLIFSAYSLTSLGIYLFSAVVVFQLVTLQVEFNASRRAMAALEGGGFVSAQEYPLAKKILSAAALTYVASLTVSVLQLLRLMALANRRR